MKRKKAKRAIQFELTPIYKTHVKVWVNKQSIILSVYSVSIHEILVEKSMNVSFAESKFHVEYVSIVKLIT